MVMMTECTHLSYTINVCLRQENINVQINIILQSIFFAARPLHRACALADADDARARARRRRPLFGDVELGGCVASLHPTNWFASIVTPPPSVRRRLLVGLTVRERLDDDDNDDDVDRFVQQGPNIHLFGHSLARWLVSLLMHIASLLRVDRRQQ